jgi:hypothetical protein
VSGNGFVLLHRFRGHLQEAKAANEAEVRAEEQRQKKLKQMEEMRLKRQKLRAEREEKARAKGGLATGKGVKSNTEGGGGGDKAALRLRQLPSQVERGMFDVFTSLQRGDAASILDAVRRRHEDGQNQPSAVAEQDDGDKTEDEREGEEGIKKEGGSGKEGD